MNNTRKKRILLSGLFILIMGVSASVTGYLTTRNNDVLAEQKQVFATVNLYDNSVTPSTLSVAVGDTIVVNNKSGSPRELSLGAGHATESTKHEDESDDSHDHNSGFSSGVIGQDEAWQATFSQVGTYFLHDHDNPDVNILVVVYGPSNTSIIE